jgi:hypothetical protein
MTPKPLRTLFLGIRRLVPRTWSDGAAMTVVLAAAFAGGGLAFHALWPSSEPRPWNERLDRVCYDFYGQMIAARQQAPRELDAAQARIEDGFVAALERVRSAVPLGSILDFNTLVNDHRSIARLRHRTAKHDPFSPYPPTAVLRERLREAEEVASVDARLMGLAVCGQEARDLE